MSERLDALRRVLKVQDGLKRAADWRLAEAERAAAEVAAARADLVGFGGKEILAGALAAVAAAQGRRLAVRADGAARAVAAEAEAMRETTARQKLLGRTIEALAREEARARERKDLERLAEAFAARPARPEG